MSTPKKIKLETTEKTDARVKLEGVLQNLVERADESLPLDEDITIKIEPEDDQDFEDGIKELEATPVKKSPARSAKKKRKRDVDGDHSHDGGRSQNTFITKLFDRSVDLGQFKQDTPLYPACRAWMANAPNEKIRPRQETPSPEPNADQDDPENSLVYRLPSPSKTLEEMTYELNRDPRIPSPLPKPPGVLNLYLDPAEIPSRDYLLYGHLQRWKLIRNKWKEASQLNQSRYSESYAILKAMYERQ